MAEILKPTPGNIARAAQSLREGDVVGMPTETVYGLAGNLFDESALARIFSVKDRPVFDPLIAHVAWKIQPADYVQALGDMGVVDIGLLSPAARARASVLLNHFWPGPFTLILPKSSRVPDLATSALPSVAVRMPRHPVARQLILDAGTPLAAPSANRFGRISPTEVKHVEQELGSRIKLILDGGPCEIGIESTILVVHPDGCLELLRPGGTPRSQIEAIAGCKIELYTPCASQASGSALAPGMLDSHYAPRKQLELWPGMLRPNSPGQPGFLAFSGTRREASERFTARYGVAPLELRVLSSSGQCLEAAGNLFRMLRELDDSSAGFLIAEPCTQELEGLGHAIQDRLKRAASIK